MAIGTDPRVERSRRAILLAAGELLRGEGPRALTHQRVARRAGVGRATVYRHWPSPGQLLLDVAPTLNPHMFDCPIPPIRTWLHIELRRLADGLAMPGTAAVTLTFIGAARPDERDAITQAVSAGLDAAFDEALRLGEIDERPDPQEATALMLGPIVYRAALQNGPVADELLDTVIDSVAHWRPVDGGAVVSGAGWRRADLGSEPEGG
jgi:Bacterial regulatory proteins, tetR family/Tetracyclin repressor-like, C-terminal domain